MESKREKMTPAERTVGSDEISLTVEDNIDLHNYILRHDHIYCESSLVKEGPTTEAANGTLIPKEEPGNEITDRILHVEYQTEFTQTHSTVTKAKREDQSGRRIVGSIQIVVGETVKSEDDSDTCMQMSEGEALNDDITPSRTSSPPHLPESQPVEISIGKKENSKISPYICVLCGEGFKTWQAVSCHLQLHIANYQSHVNPTTTHVLDTNSLTTQGTDADKAAQSSSNVSNDGDSDEHSFQVLSSTNKKHRCISCGKEFPSSSGLTTHERFCTESRPYKCNFCSTRYKQHYDLSQHVKNCPQCTCRCAPCDRGFINSHALNQHILTHTGERPYKCSICGKSFTQRSGYNYHMRTHTGEKPYTCSVCGHSFTQTSSLWRHMMKFHMVHKCSVCKRGFTKLSALQEHTLSHVQTTKKSQQGLFKHSLLRNKLPKKNLYMCCVCNKVSKTRLDVHRHMQSHKNNQPQPCSTDQTPAKSECGDREDTGPDQMEKIISSSSLEDIDPAAIQQVYRAANTDKVQGHSTIPKTTTHEKPHQCSVCKKRFTVTSTLKEHMMTHTGEYKCGVCSQMFTCLTRVTQHIKSHIGEQPLKSKGYMSTQTLDKPCKCGVCNKTFREVKCLISHMRVHSGETGPDQMEKIISSGPLEYIDPAAIQQVYRAANTDKVQGDSTIPKTTTHEKPHQSSVCKKRFTGTSTLKKHMMTHTGEYKCGVCSQMFTCLSRVTQHIKSHIGEQPFKSKGHMSTQTLDKPCKCGVCNKTFREVKCLISHMRVHSGEKLTGTSTLKKHMMTHTGEYKCGVCSQMFTCLTRVTQHIKSHIGEQPLKSKGYMSTQTLDKPCKCGVCNKTFREVKCLISHMRVHSGETGPDQMEKIISSGPLEYIDPAAIQQVYRAANTDKVQGDSTIGLQGHLP